MKRQNFKNLHEMNQILKTYANKGVISPSKSCSFLIKTGKLVIRFQDCMGISSDLCVGYFDANQSSVNIVNKLIKKNSN